MEWRDGATLIAVEAFAGRLSDGGAPVDATTPYDLASLTKPVVAMAALKLVASGKLSLDLRADAVLADVRGTTAGPATLEALLTHRAGLAAWGGLYLDVQHDPGTSAARRWMVSEAARRPEEQSTAKTVYSDLGYLIAGEMIARAAGESLDKVVARQITDPLGISGELFYASALSVDKRAGFLKRVAPTERCEWRGVIVRGEVHDENAAAFGGVAGHAGLFGTARAVTTFARAVLDSLVGKSTFLPKELVAQALAPRDGATLRLGWDSKSPDGSSAGRRMGQGAFGHLGFTGTSVWCDPEKEIVVSLLSNRVHPSRANERIKGFRPAFHDGMLALIEG